ncbi:MAG: hypothetical protein IH914_06210, partial [candidate division Zixibacteria bacterium]|nr:hypothetical protein [candidate division Zixibacteria bacterium]
MINITSFFNQLASQYAARYYSIAERFTPPAPPASSTIETGPESPAISSSEQVQPDPATLTPTTSQTGEPQDTLELSAPSSTELQTTDPAGQTIPGATSATYEREFSHLRYSLDLNFNAEALADAIKDAEPVGA